MTEIQVLVDGFRYVVRFDDQGEPYAVYLRQTYAAGQPWQSFYNQSKWNRTTHGKVPSRGRILKAVEAARSQL